MKPCCKRILCLSLALLTLLSLWGCQRKPTTTSEPQTLTAKLSPEQAAAFQSGLCCILYRTGQEKYVVLLETSQVTLEEQTLTTRFDGQLLQMAQEGSVNLPLSVQELEDGLYQAPGMLWTLEGGEKAQGAPCLWILDTQEGGSIRQCLSPEGTPLSHTDRGLCSFVLEELTLGLTEDGAMLPPAQWPATGQEYYLDFPPETARPISFGPVELDANYDYTFVVTLTDGSVFTTGLSALG